MNPCIDCKYFDIRGGKFNPRAICHRYGRPNYVTGGMIGGHCDDLRQPGGSCGPEGKGFEFAPIEQAPVSFFKALLGFGRKS